IVDRPIGQRPVGIYVRFIPTGLLVFAVTNRRERASFKLAQPTPTKRPRLRLVARSFLFPWHMTPPAATLCLGALQAWSLPRGCHAPARWRRTEFQGLPPSDAIPGATSSLQSGSVLRALLNIVDYVVSELLPHASV